MTVSIKRGDRPAYTCVLTLGNAPLDLTGKTVTFRMIRRGSGAAKINDAPATIVGDPKAGRVTYQFGETDADTVGSYTADWRVSDGAGSVRTYPDGSYLQISIHP